MYTALLIYSNITHTQSCAITYYFVSHSITIITGDGTQHKCVKSCEEGYTLLTKGELVTMYVTVVTHCNRILQWTTIKCVHKVSIDHITQIM